MKRSRTIHDDDGRVLATYIDASPEAVDFVLEQSEHDDGRSGWTWVTLPNGDVMLGVWPRGDTYMATETDREGE